MKRIYNTYIMRSVTLLLVILLTGMMGYAKLSDRYNNDKPLVIACDWDLPPYEFLDDRGNPAGYNIDILDKILKEMNLKHTFILKENPQIKELFMKKEADLYVAPSSWLSVNDCYMSENILNYYKVKIAMQKDVPAIRSIKDISPNKKVVLRENGMITIHSISEQALHLNIQYHAPMEALSGVSSGKYDYFIWGEEPLKWKIKELNIENLKIHELNVSIQEIHIGGHDKELIDAIDDQYARLEQRGELELIRDKWFHPERHHDNASPYILYIAIAAVLLILLLSLLNRLIARNVRRMTLKNSEQARLMDLALDLGGYMVAEYDVQKDQFKNMHGNLMDESFSVNDAYNLLHEDDRYVFQEKIRNLKSSESGTSDILLRRNTGTESQPHWQYLSGNCIKENDDAKHTSYILVAKDITKEMDEQHSNNEAAAKYLKAFDISLVAMAFYDKDGRLLEMNEQMRKVTGTSPENQKFFYETRLFDAPLFKDILFPNMKEVTHACQHTHYPDINLDKYLEYRIRPVFSDEGEIRYYVVTVRDITGERNLYKEQQTIQQQLEMTNNEVNKFETQMNYLLSNTNMYIWRSNYQKNTIEISRSLNKVEKVITFEEYLQSLPPDEIEEAKMVLYNPLMRSRTFSFIRHHALSPLTKQEAWFAVSGTPIFDQKGLGIGHFGVVRNVTQLMRAQEELRKETERAQQSGALKATFLANMTHEIRTPLNAIVGFSDLLHMASTTEERTEFIHIIRHNCDLLLRLIDDLLETSDMNENAQRIEPENIDFALFFNEMGQTLEQRVQEPSVKFLMDNPYSTFPVRTDKERIQQVITNFVTNAVKYTHEGHIRIGYIATSEVSGDTPTIPSITEKAEIHESLSSDNGILIYCEDTGAGIPPEKQSSVFDRFVKLDDYVQGTGLGLSICKSIAERCNGRIGLISEGKGKGSTFWLWIPRYLTLGNLTIEK